MCDRLFGPAKPPRVVVVENDTYSIPHYKCSGCVDCGTSTFEAMVSALNRVNSKYMATFYARLSELEMCCAQLSARIRMRYAQYALNIGALEHAADAILQAYTLMSDVEDEYQWTGFKRDARRVALLKDRLDLSVLRKRIWPSAVNDPSPT